MENRPVPASLPSGPSARPVRGLTEVAMTMLGVGARAFGGPIAVLGQLEAELVRKRAWISPEHFAETVALCKLFPGPMATQAAISIAREASGSARIGIVGGVAFILPAFVSVIGLGLIYDFLRASNAHAAQVQIFLGGMQAGALGVIGVSIFALGKPVLASNRGSSARSTWAIAIAAAALTWLAPRAEPLVIIGFGAIGAGLAYGRGKKSTTLHGFDPVTFAMALALFGVAFKAAVLTFGTGLAVVPLLEADVVRGLGWLTHEQFVDALTIGQITPGPVVITMTFIGWMKAGGWGALFATFGMFLPSFFFALVALPFARRRLAASALGRAFVAWVMPAVVGALFASAVFVLGNVLEPPFSAKALLQWALITASVVITVAYRAPAWMVIPGAGVLNGVLNWACATFTLGVR